MSSPSKLKLFIIYSIAAHILLSASLLIFSNSKYANEQNKNIEISLIDPNLETKKINDKAKIVVEADTKMANNQTSENAKYLSEKSNTVEKETKAKSGKNFLNAKEIHVQQKTTASASENIKPELFNSGFDAYSALNKKNETQRAAANTQKPVIQNSAASSTNDNLKNIESDLITRLNTREYKYYGYYTRIKNQLNQWWVPQVQQKFTKMMRQGRMIASEENKITKLVIILNEVGNLVNVQVLAESGVRDLDEAAIEAFRQAAPFPNPPKGMVEHDGTVKIRWDCVVES